jgi:inosine-uridine nucleoside N-ribohydrolase
VTENKSLIIDCDPGCDDALGIMLAVRKGSYREIIITTTAGNVPVARTTINAQKIASLACVGLEKPPEIAIYQGSSTSLIGNAPNVMSVHGRDGMGDVPHRLYSLPSGTKLIPIEPEKSAVEFLRNIATETNQYDLVCTGPLTNLATALSLAPDPEALLKKFNKVVVMGGSFNMRGNVTPTAEFNFFFDPIAVKIVLDLWKKVYQTGDNKDKNKIILVPLDITERVQLHKQHFIVDDKFLHRGRCMQAMLQKYFRFHSFSERGLVNDCAKGTCSHSHSQLSQCEYLNRRDITEKIKKERYIGKSGNKHLPEFCYLHDPLAVYLAVIDGASGLQNGLEEARISIHTNDDEMRGSLYQIDRKVSYSTRDSYTDGTMVKFLSPNEVKPGDLKNFRKDLLSACGWLP